MRWERSEPRVTVKKNMMRRLEKIENEGSCCYPRSVVVFSFKDCRVGSIRRSVKYAEIEARYENRWPKIVSMQFTLLIRKF